MPEPKTAVTAPARDEKGRVLPGHRPPGAGRPKGALNHFTRAIREEGAEQIREMETRGIPANPIKILLHVAEKAHEKGDLELMLKAGIALAGVFLPTKMALEIDIADEGEAEEKRVAIAAVLAKWTPRELRAGGDTDVIAPNI